MRESSDSFAAFGVVYPSALRAARDRRADSESEVSTVPGDVELQGDVATQFDEATQLDEDSNTELEDSADDNVTNNIAESTPLQPKDAAGDNLVNKIAKSTQLQPKHVKSVLAALKTVAYADLNNKGSFVIPQHAIIKQRYRTVKGGRLLIGGNWRLEKPMED